MGQGTESAGGYEIDYDPAYEGLNHGVPLWNGTIPVTSMSRRYVVNALNVARNASHSATFECDAEKWSEWVDILEQRLSEMPKPVAKYTGNIKKRGKTKRMRCHCGSEYDAREADLKRGYAKSCSKRCAAIRREFGRPAGKAIK
tara:strand:+ start:1947 stop:2378 length:432 start_codon:yes stop_codon:yes gene_type:complete